MFELLFSSKYDIYFYSTLEDVFTIVMLYSFLKLILLSSVIELLWPTQFFNRRHSSSTLVARLRSYTECFSKVRFSSPLFSKQVVAVNFN